MALRRTITIDNTKVSGGSNLTDFRMLFKGTETWLKTKSNGGDVENVGGFDLIFWADSNRSTQLDHEIVNYDGVNGTFIAWVRIPTLKAASDTDIYLSYGDNTISSSQENVTSVWGTAYEVVYHGKNSTTTTIADSTSKARLATKFGVGEPVEATGQIYKGQNFDGVDDIITVPSMSLDMTTLSMTWSAWINITYVAPNPAYANYQIMSLWPLVGMLLVNNAGVNYKIGGWAASNATASGAASYGAWHHVAVAYQGAGSNSRITYIDGVATGTDTSGSVFAWGGVQKIGENPYTAVPTGTIEEVRMKKDQTSVGWLLTRFNNENDPSTFYGIQDAVDLSAAAGTLRKKYFYRLYDVNRTYLGNLDDTVVTTEPGFTWAVNSGMGSHALGIATTLDGAAATDLINGEIPAGEVVTRWDDIYQWDAADSFWDKSPGTITEVHGVDAYVVDADDPTGKIVFSGILKKPEQFVSNSGNEGLTWNLYSWVTEMTATIYEDSSNNTTITHTNTDPSAMLKDVIDRFNAKKNYFTYDSDSIQNTGLSITYTFKYVTCKEALDKIIELCPNNWVYYLDADRKFHLFQADTAAPTHVLNLGVEFNEWNGSIDRSNIVNKIYFKGGDTGGGSDLYKLYQRAGSIALYGEQEITLTDSRVTIAATAEQKANRILNEREAPVKEISLFVPDSNSNLGELKGYDIESFKPGDSVEARNPAISTNITKWDSTFNWDEAYWDATPNALFGIPLFINGIGYTSTGAQLTLKTGVPTFAKRQKDIERNLVDEQSLTIPAQPS